MLQVLKDIALVLYDVSIIAVFVGSVVLLVDLVRKGK